MAPKRSQYEPEGHQKGPNLSKKDTKMSQKEPKGCQRGAKTIPKIDKNIIQKSADTGRCQAFQTEEARWRSAAFGGLPSLPPGGSPWDLSGLQKRTFEIFFWYQMLV